MISENRANKSIGYEFGKREFEPASIYYLGLSTTPIDNGTGYKEPDISVGYARVPISNDSSSWTEPSGRIVSNLTQLSFPIFTDSAADDIKITHWFLSECEDSAQEGDCAIYYGELPSPRPIVDGSQIWVNIGDLQIERTNP